jgi:hypothetical protein
MAHTLPKLIVLFCAYVVRKCVLYNCHWVTTQWQLTYKSYHIIKEVKTQATPVMRLIKMAKF